MFNSKIKGFFLSFVTVALLGILVTSCEREAIAPALNDSVNLIEENSKIPAAPSVELGESDNVESRGCVKNGCNNYVTSVTYNQVKGFASYGETVTVWYYDVTGTPIAYQQFTAQVGGVCSFTYNLNPPGNATCDIAAFVGTHCGIRWIAGELC